MTTLLLVAALAAAAETPPRATVVVVLGAPGQPQYEAAHRDWAARWERAAAEADARLVRIGHESPDKSPDRDRLAAVLETEPQGADLPPLWLVLIGHGTFDGQKAKFNLRGPDLAAAELAQWLDPFDRPVVVINCASSSAPFINRLSRAGRVLLTATKSGYQWNATRLGDYLSAAIADPAADLDKDGQTSLLEAFLMASRQTREWYEAQGRLATETALVDDNGDGRGTPASWFRGTRARGPQGTAPDGDAARQIHLLPSPHHRRLSPEQRRRCLQLEQAIARLRDSKTPETDEDAYYAQLEPLLVELARIDHAADAGTQTPAPDSPSSAPPPIESAPPNQQLPASPPDW